MESLTKVANEITGKGGKAVAIACHMGDMNDIGKLFENIEKTYGRLDILVGNNAATNPYFGEMTGVDEGVWSKTFDG